MAPERDASTEASTPTNATKSLASSTTNTKWTSNSKQNTVKAPQEPPARAKTKAKAKRPLSTSSSLPPTKRTTMASSSTPSTKQSYAYTDLPSTQLPKPTTSTATAKAPIPATLQLTYHTGDIFTAPPRTLLIHACNTQGHWGAGIAKAFKTLYPKGYKVHHDFCAKEHGKDNVVPTGTAQLITPVDRKSGEEDGNGGHWIGCLFTSARYGKKKDKPDEIVKHTGESMEMLLELIRMADEEWGKGNGIGTIRMCKVNSGKFGVPWERTEEILKGIVLREGWRGTVEVWEPVEG
ncbi:hypothetical protein IQ06DRAFT_291420 [Phaeosphaeriaceae sp. SRC1lsM3a]|nr:hypothetical protein IQ06DRAFT_291420 [Stagonospora sp. SRC1lsM3a]